MRVLTYQGLDVKPFKAAFDRFRTCIERGDLKGAKIKKLRPSSYYRIKLDDTNRLLLEFRQYQGQTVCLALEVIWQHRYDRSRFLRNGAAIDETAIEAAADVDSSTQVDQGARPLTYLHPDTDTFAYQSEPLSFDADQTALLSTPAPLLLLGSAGSGKTALMLERLRHEPHPALYLTRSAALARHARSLYRPGDEQVDFLSVHDLLSLASPLPGEELGYPAFLDWASRQRDLLRFTRPRLLFEELRGVTFAASNGPLDLDAYRALGVRRSLYAPHDRPRAHEAAQVYRAWLDTQSAYDPNLAAHARLGQAPQYHTLAIDEVQDLSPVMTRFAFEHLHPGGALLLAGDAHQLVFPGSFSWNALRGSVGDHHKAGFTSGRIHALNVNFRSARRVVETANRVLRVKQKRFGSLEREDTLLPRPHGDETGQVQLRSSGDAAYRQTRKDVQGHTGAAVLVLREEHRAEAARLYRTPLIFSIENAKGLEYDHIVLHRLIGCAPDEYAQIAQGVHSADLEGELKYARATDKTDKSLSTLGPLINSLYVGLTRARRSVTVIEDDPSHPLLQLILPGSADTAPPQKATDSRAANSRAADSRAADHEAEPVSSRADWERQIQKLTQAGHTEQAAEIRAQNLGYLPVPWPVMNEERLRPHMNHVTYTPRRVSQGEETTLRTWATLHHQAWVLEALYVGKGTPATGNVVDRNLPDTTLHPLTRPALEPYRTGVNDSVRAHCERHGPDHLTTHGLTPLCLAVITGNLELAEWLTEHGADSQAQDSFGHTAHMHLYRAEQRTDAQTVRALHYLLAPPDLTVRLNGQVHVLPQGSFEHRTLDLLLSSLKTFSSCFGTDFKTGFKNGFTDRRGVPGHTLQALLAHEQNACLRPRQDETDLPWEQSTAAQAAFTRAMARSLDEHALWLPTGQAASSPAGQFLPNPDLEVLEHHPEHGERWVGLAERFHFALLDLPASFRRWPAAVQAKIPLERANMRASGNAGQRRMTLALDSHTARLEAEMPGRFLPIDRTVMWKNLGATTLPTPPGGAQTKDKTNSRHNASLGVRCYRRLVQQGLMVPDERNDLHPLIVDQSGAVCHSDALADLSDDALGVLLAILQQRDDQHSTAAVSADVQSELRAAGFSNLLPQDDQQTAGERAVQDHPSTDSEARPPERQEPDALPPVSQQPELQEPAAEVLDLQEVQKPGTQEPGTQEPGTQSDSRARPVRAAWAPDLRPATPEAARAAVSEETLARELERAGFRLIPLKTLRRTEGLPDVEVDGGLDSFLAACRMHGVNLVFASVNVDRHVTRLHGFVPGLQLSYTFSSEVNR